MTRGHLFISARSDHLDHSAQLALLSEYLVRLFLEVCTASLRSSPGKCNLMAVSISLELRVYFFEMIIRFLASFMIFSKSSAMMLLMRAMPFLEMPSSGFTSFRTRKM